uniref:Uncharacterized protein n=1 Tax=Podoviridae sp. ct1h53 TaxID=2826536 RepID=A0A8S5MGH8_9CAUD|nr:MAG TPA: hypothetical protein [Podoviridae sp. ct1h53]
MYCCFEILFYICKVYRSSRTGRLISINFKNVVKL